MLHFENDYNEGIHPILLQALIDTNEENLPGYGMDYYCQRAAQKIKEACSCPKAEVAFLAGGTQTNQIVIESMLATYEGVIAAETGHIAVHEAGAIEYTGHKVLQLPSHLGKIDIGELENLITEFYEDKNYEHMVFPGMVYISHPTEYGTLYTKEELKLISDICHRQKIPLFVDGARLGYALASKETDVDLATLSDLADVFYIGGTKMGALAGEAVVFTRGNMPKHFNTVVKQRGALTAKGRFFGIQFDCFFTDNLYLQIGEQALEHSNTLKDILREKNYQFYLESPTNQQFVIIENTKLEALAEVVSYGFWEKYDANHTVIRFATSWSTTEADLNALRKIL